jgi:hypothetical protein
LTPFEYATGLVSIVIGLAFARVLGRIGAFITEPERSASDWFAASWCIVVLVNLGGWWIAVWNSLQRQMEIGFAALLAVCCLGAHFAVVAAMDLPFGMAQDPRDLVETVLMAAVAVAGAAAKSTRMRVLHLVIWSALLVAMLADNTPRIALSD